MTNGFVITPRILKKLWLSFVVYFMLLLGLSGTSFSADQVSPFSGIYDPLLSFDESKWRFDKTKDYSTISVSGGEIKISGNDLNGPNTADNSAALQANISAKTWSADIKIDEVSFIDGMHPSGITIRMADSYSRNGTTQHMEVDFFIGSGQNDFVFGYADFHNGEERFNLNYTLPANFSIREFHNYKLSIDKSNILRYFIDNTEIARVNIPTNDGIVENNGEYFRVTGKVSATIKNIEYSDAIYIPSSGSTSVSFSLDKNLVVDAGTGWTPTALQADRWDSLNLYCNKPGNIRDPSAVAASAFDLTGDAIKPKPFAATGLVQCLFEPKTAHRGMEVTFSVDGIYDTWGETFEIIGDLHFEDGSIFGLHFDRQYDSVGIYLYSNATKTGERLILTPAGQEERKYRVVIDKPNKLMGFWLDGVYQGAFDLNRLSSSPLKYHGQMFDLSNYSGPEDFSAWPVIRSFAYLPDDTQAATLTALTVSGPATLQANGSTPLSASASYSDNSSKPVTSLSWASSDPVVATVSTTGELAAGSVTVDTPVTITASYTENGVTVTASKTITISAAPATLASLVISADATVPTGAVVLLRTSAIYSDGSNRNVMFSSWSVSPASLGTVNSRGELTVGTVTTDTPLTLTASYSEDGITAMATATITVKATAATLTGLSIRATKGELRPGESLGLNAMVVYSNNVYKPVSAQWSLADTTAAIIYPNGEVQAKGVSTDTPVTITATYNEDGQTLTARFMIVVRSTTWTPRLSTEVISAQNTSNLTSLKLWFNPNAEATVRASHTHGYKLYVAAMIPAGPLTPEPLLLLLNRSRQWQGVGWPLAEYLSGVQENDWQLIELLDSFDTSIISGTQIYVGYGESDTEMLEAGRYEMVYQLP